MLGYYYMCSPLLLLLLLRIIRSAAGNVLTRRRWCWKDLPNSKIGSIFIQAGSIAAKVIHQHRGDNVFLSAGRA